MRIAVLLLGLFGGAVCAALGTHWMLGFQDKEQFQAVVALTRMEFLTAGTAERKAEIQSAYQTIVGQHRSYPFLLAALGLGVAGGILTFKGRPFCGAALLLATVAGLALLYPPTLIFTSLLTVAGVLSFFAGPPRPRPTPAEGEE